MRRAKIVCTLGPAVEGKAEELIRAGMNVARINFSHGNHEEHRHRYDEVRAASKTTGQFVAILADLQGPKIRLGNFAAGPHVLAPGDPFTITTQSVEGTATRVSTTYLGLPGDCQVGDNILVDDGKVSLRVTAVTDTDVVTTVEVGGPVSNHKGLNLPGVAVSVPALSDKDEDDLRFALELGVDFVALSFVRSAADIDAVHRIMAEVGVRRPVIAKIEKPQAVDDLSDIVRAFDGIMIARGDLGVELPLEDVPMVQKRAIDMARRAAKPVIVATQVLESMIAMPRPTRAEASDCANAVLDGADAIMLSGETSVGKYPLECVQTMSSIIESTEYNGLDRIPTFGAKPTSRSGVLTYAANTIADVMSVDALVAYTVSGDAARRLSRLRPPIPLVAFTSDPVVCNQLALSWGVDSLLIDYVDSTDKLVAQVDDQLLHHSRSHEGDIVVIVFGSPIGVSGSVNAIRVHCLGDAINKVDTHYGTPQDFDIPGPARWLRTQI